MSVFLGSLIVFALCGLALGLGVLMGGVPAERGCTRVASGLPRCDDCPNQPKPDGGEPLEAGPRTDR